jgi:penicillin-binding protein 1A
VLRGTGTKAQFAGFDIGGKTGTSQDYRDGWFVGFTTHYVTGVWMGNDDNAPTKALTGGSLPALVWRDIMEPAHEGYPSEILPGEAMPAVSVATVAEDQWGPEVQIQNDSPVQEPVRRRKRTLLDLLFGGKGSRQGDLDHGLY